MFDTTEYGAAFTTMAVIKRVGKAAGIGDTDFLTPAEIRAALSERNPETSLLLEAFLAAFKSWYNITELVQSHLHNDRRLLDEHVQAIENRNVRRAELQEHLNYLQ